MTRFVALGLLSFACVGLIGNVGCKRAKQDAPSPASTVKKATLDDVIAQYKPLLDPKIAAVQKIGASLPKPTGHDALKLDKGPIHLLTGSTVKLAHGAAAGSTPANATMIQVEDLHGDLTTLTPKEMTTMTENIFLDCAAIVTKKDTPSTFTASVDPDDTARVLKQCTSFVYLLVVRTASKTVPTVDMGAHTFTAGHADGDVLVYDIDTGKDLGSFRFSARTPHDIKLNESDPLHGLFQDVADKQWASIRDSFEKLAPGSTVQSPE